MATAEIRWIQPPAAMARALAQYGDKVLTAVQMVAEKIAQDHLQPEMRANAPWEDRTGNARSGLFAAVVREAARDIVVIYLSHGHTVYYGVFLELARGGKYAIIMPTLERNLPRIKKMLDDLFD